MNGLAGYVRLCLTILFALVFGAWGGSIQAAAQAVNLTVAVLVNSTNTTGYNTNPANPGKYQLYAERYFDHLQIPYEIFDLSTTLPPSDLNTRQLIVAAHPGLSPSPAWQTAIQNAVQGGAGFVNLDSSPQTTTAQHLLKIFGASGFASGTASTAITVPAALGSGGATPHFITSMQWKSPLESPGDFVYSFHPDQLGKLKTATATVLQNANGTVIARLGSDPLITATTFGAGRAVSFGTLDYLQADRFGFMMGVDDLFWRSLVWAARKPFVLRGYPRLWALRMDHNVDTDWWSRVQEMYDPALTGKVVADGSPWGAGGPWKVTGSVYLNFLQSEQPGRAQIINDMKAGKLQVSPHGFQSSAYGDLFWDGSTGPLTDAGVQDSIQAILDWEGKSPDSPISDPLPDMGLSKWMVGHFYDLSDNLGHDLWDLGFRYISTTERPGFEYTTDPSESAYLAGRLPARPYWKYQLPPKPASDYASDEAFSFFFADDLTIGSREGLPAKNFSLIGSRALDSKLAGSPDLGWCNSVGNGLGFAQGKFEWYTWRLFSSLAPVEAYTHDDAFSQCVTAPANPAFPPLPADIRLPGGLMPNASQQMIQGVSKWLSITGAHQVFMQDLAQYAYARGKSVLSKATFNGTRIDYTFTGSAADVDGNLVPTQVLVFPGEGEGAWQTIPGFSNGLTTALAPPPAPVIVPAPPPPPPTTVPPPPTIVPPPPPIIVPTAPAISRISPSSGPASGGNIINLHGTSFTPDTQITIGGISPARVTFVDPTLMTAMVPANAVGKQAVVSAGNSIGLSTLATPYIYLEPVHILLQDSFNGDANSTWNIVPDSLAKGWGAVNGAKDYAGLGASQQYGGADNWQDCTFEVKIKLFTLQNYPGGVRVRVNPVTGSGYALWLYPGNSEIKLLRATAWDIDTPGMLTLARAPLKFDVDNFHTLQLKMAGAVIIATWDGTTLFSVTDTAYATGGVALDASSQHIQFEDALVTGTAPPPRFITGVKLSPPALQLVSGGATQQLTLTAAMSDGSTMDLTRNADTVYSSSNSSAAVVSRTGLITSESGGLATITASHAGYSITASLAVISPTAPVITRISPARGSTAGGYLMDIYGSNLGSSTLVTIQGQTASVVSIAPHGDMMTVAAPAGVAGKADVVVSNGRDVPATLSCGYTYLAPSSILFQDSFNAGRLDRWTPSTLGKFTAWTATQHLADYSGSGHTQIFAAGSSWTDYTIETQFKVFAGTNYAGGLRGRVNSSTGAGYEAWILPGSNMIVLYKTTGWNIDSPGLARLADAAITIAPNVFNNLKLKFSGTQISVIYNGATIIKATDSALSGGTVALDVSNQHIQFEDVLVTAP